MHTLLGLRLFPSLFHSSSQIKVSTMIFINGCVCTLQVQEYVEAATLCKFCKTGTLLNLDELNATFLPLSDPSLEPLQINVLDYLLGVINQLSTQASMCIFFSVSTLVCIHTYFREIGVLETGNAALIFKLCCGDT